MSLIIRSVNIRFLKTQETLIKNLTFEIFLKKEWETINLMGPCACGKSHFFCIIFAVVFPQTFKRLPIEVFLDKLVSLGLTESRTRKKKNLTFGK